MVRVQPVLLRRFNHAEYHRAPPGPIGRIGKQKVLPAYHEGLNTALSTVVAHLQPPVLQIPRQVRPLFSQIVQRFAESRLRRRLLRFRPRQQRVKKGLGPFLPLFVPFFRSQIGKFFLQGKQGAAVPLALQCCALRLLLFGQGLHCLVKHPSGVRPARRRMLHIPRPAASGRAGSFRRASSPAATRSAGLAAGFKTPPRSSASGWGCTHAAQSGMTRLHLFGTATCSSCSGRSCLAPAVPAVSFHPRGAHIPPHPPVAGATPHTPAPATPPLPAESIWTWSTWRVLSPCRFHSCSCWYNGDPITNFCVMIWTMASAEV